MAYIVPILVSALVIFTQNAHGFHTPYSAASGRAAALAQAQAQAVYNSKYYDTPYLPQSSSYSTDLLKYCPYYLPCNCRLSGCFQNPEIEIEIEFIVANYDFNSCDVEQWAFLIEDTMCGIPVGNEASMLYDISQAVQRELIRRNLVHSGKFPDFCLSYNNNNNNNNNPFIDPMLNNYDSLDDIPLGKRDPMYTEDDAYQQGYESYGRMNSAQDRYLAAARNSGAMGSALASGIFDPQSLSESPYNYYMQYLFHMCMPDLSYQLQYELKEAVLENTPSYLKDEVNSLYAKLKFNIRGLLSEMIDVDAEGEVSID